jgi:pSer/pThr/pTyr-binding forkhead associated (FHA) protein
LDVLDLAILALRLALVAALYVFLLVVIRMATRELRASTARRGYQPNANLRLVVLEAGESSLAPGEVIEVSDGAVLGRAERAEVVVADSAVSAEHLRLRRHGAGWLVADLGSTNGTLVNEALVRGERPIDDGDVLALGNVRMKVALRPAHDAR